VSRRLIASLTVAFLALLAVPSAAAAATTFLTGASSMAVRRIDASPSPYVVSKVGTQYRARSQTTGTTFNGTLKFVVESAVADLEVNGGGTVHFNAGTFDYGTEFFHANNAHDLIFEGAGIDVTIIKNSSTAAADTEPFNFDGVDRVTIRDMTVSAGGTARSTSDALDFDKGNDVLVQRVKVTASRSRAIIFDGKDQGATSLRNQVKDCVITGGVRGDGIELLASSQDTIQGCTIKNVGGHGIQLNKSSPTAFQPNKKTTDSTVSGNTITNSGQDGVNVNSSDHNTITGNTIKNSSDDKPSRDGIRIDSSDSVTCDDNTVSNNTATDTQATKTQKYGLNIASPLCNRTVVGPGNNFSGNRTGAIHDLGTGTIYQ
jgi:parallel beta-helix repeat protein